MNRPDDLRRRTPWGYAVAAVALLCVAADEPKQTIDAKGLTFDAPKSWKSTPLPATSMRAAQLRVEAIEGDDYPAEMAIFAMARQSGSVEDNLKRWQSWFKDEDGNPSKMESRKVQGKNVEVVRAETHGEYHPAQLGGRAEPVRKGARFLGAIVTTDGASYYIRMVGPDKTMKKLTPDFDEMLKTMKVGE
jgi:hypothetical protein